MAELEILQGEPSVDLTNLGMLGSRDVFKLSCKDLTDVYIVANPHGVVRPTTVENKLVFNLSSGSLSEMSNKTEVKPIRAQVQFAL